MLRRCCASAASRPSSATIDAPDVTSFGSRGLWRSGALRPLSSIAQPWEHSLKHYCGSIYRLAHRYQLGPSELGYDKPEAAQHITMPVEGGDVLILATDGLVWTSLLPHSTQSLSARNKQRHERTSSNTAWVRVPYSRHGRLRENRCRNLAHWSLTAWPLWY